MSATHLNLIIIGETAVGKTSLLHRKVYNKFDPEEINTIGVSQVYYEYAAENGDSVGFQFWDTAGQERYNSIVSSYSKNADGVIVVFDLTKLDTFQMLSKWI